MNRFEWLLSPDLLLGEVALYSAHQVQLYDGDDKTDFKGGKLQVTSHRLLWQHAVPECDSGGGGGGVAVPMRCIVLVECEPASLFHCAKVRLTLTTTTTAAVPSNSGRGGPWLHSRFDYVKLAFRSGSGGGQASADMTAVSRHIQSALQRQQWLITDQLGSSSSSGVGSGAGGGKRRAAGIVGIEQTIVARQTQQQQAISDAFHDLRQLMERAREMTGAARQLSQQLHARQGGISADETVQLQAHLLSLGLSDPASPTSATTSSSGAGFHQQLAAEMCQLLEPVVRQSGGLLPLTDAFCRMNRARGLAPLLAPTDLVTAAKLLEQLQLPLRYHQLPSGVCVLQLATLDAERVAADVAELVNSSAAVGCVTAERAAEMMGLSVLLASQRLLEAERLGVVCRDDSVEGLVFYYNRFLHDQPPGGVVS